MSPVASKLEQVCEEWITDLFGLPQGTALGLVTGSSNALICALAAARNELLKRQGYDIKVKGLRNAPSIRDVMSAGVHSCVGAALSVLGIGSEEIDTVPVDGMGRIIPSEIPPLNNTCLLILQAGNVNGGSFDAFDEICDMANKAGAWVHIDGAFGLWAACSEKQKYLTKGFEKADSWDCDAHKTLNAGYDCGLVMCRHREALTEALSANGAYIAYGENRDNMLYTTEMSRRARGVIGEVTAETIGNASIDELQSLGMTFRKAEYIKDFSLKIINGEFDLAAVEHMTDEEAIMALAALKGIGVWTAEMILLFCLQRPNILSYDDLAIQRGMRMVYHHRKIDRKLFDKYRRRLSPYCSVASLYFWAVAGGAIPEMRDYASGK